MTLVHSFLKKIVKEFKQPYMRTYTPKFFNVDDMHNQSFKVQEYDLMDITQVEKELEQRWEHLPPEKLADIGRSIHHIMENKKIAQLSFVEKQIELYQLMEELIIVKRIFNRIKHKYSAYPQFVQRFETKLEIIKSRILRKITEGL